MPCTNKVIDIIGVMIKLITIIKKDATMNIYNYKKKLQSINVRVKKIKMKPGKINHSVK